MEINATRAHESWWSGLTKPASPRGSNGPRDFHEIGLAFGWSSNLVSRAPIRVIPCLDATLVEMVTQEQWNREGFQVAIVFAEPYGCKGWFGGLVTCKESHCTQEAKEAHQASRRESTNFGPPRRLQWPSACNLLVLGESESRERPFHGGRHDSPSRGRRMIGLSWHGGSRP
ncbi:hypothetical protein CRG98_032784 [Punica granatum]|uniref:Uncharacterized protein n=1 Tax=Punica granatum TaxID=22663 RepID=A0A2I0ITV2_PUNGR|nr:hypothetical protein CRG98_032784 [Punica granatum]